MKRLNSKCNSCNFLVFKIYIFKIGLQSKQLNGNNLVLRETYLLIVLFDREGKMKSIFWNYSLFKEQLLDLYNFKTSSLLMAFFVFFIACLFLL
jgi:hypothetical protein